MISNGHRYALLKVKRRDIRIEKLKSTVQSLKDYVRKVARKGYLRKKIIRDLREKLKESELRNKDIQMFLRTSFEKRVHNAMDYMLRFHRTYEQQKDLTYRDLYLLMYLYKSESSSTKQAADWLGMSVESVTQIVFDLSKKDMLVSRKIGRFNYMYVTEYGKTVIRSFFEVLRKQKTPATR